MRKVLTTALALALAGPLAIGAAHAQQAEVKFGDLDLETDAGKTELEARIRNAARVVCTVERTTGTRIPTPCRNELRQQVLAKVEAWQDRVGKGG